MSNVMDWPINGEWKCETCGADRAHLKWAVAHGVCQCDVCETIYNMGNAEAKRGAPRSMMMSPKAAKICWEENGVSIFNVEPDVWEEIYQRIGHEVPKVEA